MGVTSASRLVGGRDDPSPARAAPDEPAAATTAPPLPAPRSVRAGRVVDAPLPSPRGPLADAADATDDTAEVAAPAARVARGGATRLLPDRMASVSTSRGCAGARWST